MNNNELKELARVIDGISQGRRWGIVMNGAYYPETTDDPIELVHKGYRLGLEGDVLPAPPPA
jgi:hypothetical protein